MSKSTKFSQALRDALKSRPEAFLLYQYDSGIKINGLVDDYGRLEIADKVILKRDKAIAFANWIKATFEVADE